MQRFYADEGFNFAVLMALGGAYHGIADAGEVLATIERVPEGDREAWIRQWVATAERLERAGAQSLRGGHRVSARTALLRASHYFDMASAMAPGASDPGAFTRLWERHRKCWDDAVELFEPPVERIAIPYQGTTLEGYFFAPDRVKTPRPTLILCNGSDGPVIAMWSYGGRSALARGWNAITFDGPGQGAALHRAKMYFRHDWEAVITPVVDYLHTRGDVDVRRIALQGISQGGYWVPRAAAFEHRLAAIVADPGVIDVASSWLLYLPAEVRALFDAGDSAAFDDILTGSTTPAERAVLAWRMAPYGTSSPFEAYRAAMKFRLHDGLIVRIACPTLILDPDDEQFWPGQSQTLYDKLGCPKHIVRFTSGEGANWHCEPAAQSLRDERVFDWLETVVASR
jgi:hypothetical protein